MSPYMVYTLLLLYVTLPKAYTVPLHSPFVLRSTNFTLPPPASPSQEPESWQKNIYILQLTRIVLLIFLAIFAHFLYIGWRNNRQLKRDGTESCSGG